MNARLANLFAPACAAALAALAALAAPATAQELTAGVVRNPNDTVTYTIDLQGPPRGLGFTLVSLLQSPQPIQIPGIWNALLVDPTLGAPLHTVPFNALGQARDQLVAPLAVANGLPVFSQAVMLDPVGQLAFADFGLGVFFAPPPLPMVPNMGIASDYNNGNINVNITRGPGGGNVTVWVNGGQKATGMLVLQPDGSGSITVPVPGGMQRGDNVTILVNGQPVQTWNH